MHIQPVHWAEETNRNLLKIKKERRKTEFFSPQLTKKYKKKQNNLLNQKKTIENREKKNTNNMSIFTQTIHIEFTRSPFPVIYHVLVEKKKNSCVFSPKTAWKRFQFTYLIFGLV